MNLVRAVIMIALLTLPARPLAAQPAPAPATGYAEALDRFIRALRATPNAPPGTVVLVTHRERVLFARAYGTRNLATRAPMTLDTPVYNASVTKAYTGLLAAMLDADGTMPLSTSVADIWPGMRMPGGIDPQALTASRLLSHSAPVDIGGLSFRSVVTGEGVGVADVAAFLSRHAAPREPVFDYDNSGPFTAATMMAVRAGMPWHDLLRRRVLAPLGMRRSSSRTEDFRRDELAICHARTAGHWQPTAPKPTALMNAAGGMFTSGNDAARFIQLFATDGASAGGVIPAAVLRRTWQRESVQNRTLWGMRRDGYGLGWDLGSFEGHRFVSRSGAYAGCRPIIAFLPENGLGVVVLSNGDAAANTHNVAILAQAIDLWSSADGAAARAATRIASYHAAAAQEVARADMPHPQLAQVRPIVAREAHAFRGRYVNDRLGTIGVSGQRGVLRLRLGASSGRLLWTGGDSFLAVIDPDPGPEQLRFERDAAGRVTALIVDDDRYARQPD